MNERILELAPVRNVLRAVARTAIPAADDLDADGWAEFEALIGSSLRTRPASLRRRLRLFLRLIQWASVLRFGRRFTRLDEARRARVLSYLQDHRIQTIRVGFWGLRTLVFMGYYGRSAAAEEIGYRPAAGGWGALRQ